MIENSKAFLVNCGLGKIIPVRTMLKKNRFFVFQIDQVGKSALHRASKKNDLDMVKLVLKYTPDINACDFFGKTPLSYAIENDNWDICLVIQSLHLGASMQ